MTSALAATTVISTDHDQVGTIGPRKILRMVLPTTAMSIADKTRMIRAILPMP